MVGAFFTALLTDFKASASNVSALVWPVVQALLPAIALAGLAGSVVWFVWGVSSVLRLVYSWTSGQRLKAQEELFNNLDRSLKRRLRGDIRESGWLLPELVEAVMTLDGFGIDTPEWRPVVSTDNADDAEDTEDLVAIWTMFVPALLPSIRRGSVRQARQATALMDASTEPCEAR